MRCIRLVDAGGLRSIPALGLVLAFVGCGLASESDVGASSISAKPDLGPAERFKEFRLFHLGTSYRGLKLSEDGSHEIRNPSSDREVGFVYGRCEPNEEGQCSPPLEIQNFPVCARNLSYFRGPGAPFRMLKLRGVPVADFGDRLEVYSGRTTVVVYSHARDRRKVVLSLRSADGRISRRHRLPRPAPGVMEGRIKRCPPPGEG